MLQYWLLTNLPLDKDIAGIILGMGSANVRRCYIAMPPLIGWAHTQNGSSKSNLADNMIEEHFL